MALNDIVGNSRRGDNFFGLSRAFAVTLVKKVRRDGPVVFAKDFFSLCIGESPLRAISHHRQVVALFAEPSMAPLVSIPLANTYLSGYVAKGIGKQARRAILLHHYRCIRDRTEEDFYSRIFGIDLPLWRKDDDGNAYTIALTFNDRHHFEGDLTVAFLSGEKRIFEISFSLAPAHAIGSGSGEVVVLSSVQGARDEFETIKRATKACRDIAPPFMLMVAIQSVAQAFGIDTIAGVPNDRQLSNLPNKLFTFNYNALWETWSAAPSVGGFYEIPVPLPEKDISEIHTRHRGKTRQKRAFKQEVGLQIAESLRAILKH